MIACLILAVPVLRWMRSGKLIAPDDGDDPVGDDPVGDAVAA
jgi:hypothetical protein